MDGTYQNPYARGKADSPLSPNASQNSAYRANINRTKTKKWVEAKTQNYDGDDWGGDDFEEEDEPEPVPVPPLRPSGARQPSYASTHSQHQQQQQQPVPPKSAAAASPAQAPPPLHIQTQQASGPATRPAVQLNDPQSAGAGAPAPFPPRASSSSPAPISAPVHPNYPPRKSSVDANERGSSRSPSVGPHSLQDQSSKTDQDQQYPPASTAGPTGSPLASVAERNNEPNFDAILGKQSQNPQAGRPSSPDLKEPVSTNVASEQASASIEPPSQQPSNLEQADEAEGAVEAEEPKRFSTSPQLPDIGRMSMFGGEDFFSGNQKRASVTSPGLSQTQEEEPAQSLGATSGGDAPASSTSTEEKSPVEKQGLGLTMPGDQQVEVQPEEPMSLAQSDETQQLQPSRPSLPGEWVTESAPVDTSDGPADTQGPAPATTTESGPVTQDPTPTRNNEDSSSDLHTNAGDSTAPAAATAVIAEDDPSEHAQETPLDESNTELGREPTTSTVASPSPVKESDALREEIIRSLSPVGPTSQSALGPPPADDSTHESTYLHGVYDDYWTGSEDHSKKRQSLAATGSNMGMSDIPPLSPRSPRRTPSAEPESKDVGSETRPRRFSWEADSSGPKPVVAAASETPAKSTSPPAVHEPRTESPQADAQAPSQPVGGLPSAAQADSSRMGIPGSDATVSHQVSQASTAPSADVARTGPQAPSPLSGGSDTSSIEPKRLSLADEKALMAYADNPDSPSPYEHPALGQSAVAESSSAAEPSAPLPEEQTSQLQSQLPQRIMSFREILEMGNPSERTAKFNETRSQFAAMDSGLDGWVSGLQTQQPEHANASPSYHAMLNNLPPPAAEGQSQGEQPSSGGQQAPQPYYQQYLNASSPTNASGGAGRSSMHLPMGALNAASDLRHQSEQVGVKGKELLKSAGKAGKGLLSKGKNKFRGDKLEESTQPTTPPKHKKADLRASLGLNFGGARHGSREEDSGLQSASDEAGGTGAAPRIPQPSRISPFEHGHDGPSNSAWTPPPDNRGATPEPVSPVSDAHSIRDGDMGESKTLHAGSMPYSTPKPISGATPHEPSQSQLIDPVSDDWVVVESDGPTEQPRQGNGKAPQSLLVRQSWGPSLSRGQPGDPEAPSSSTQAPKRNSSFIGLPPIRRASTFGLNYARKAKERFALDDDEAHYSSLPPNTRFSEAGPSTLPPQQTDGRYGEPSTWFDTDTSTGTHTRVNTREGNVGDSMGASTIAPRLSMDSEEVDVGEDPEKAPLPAPANNKPPQERTGPPRTSPGIGPLPPGGNPIQQLPPKGWTVESSHLTQPLAESRPRHHSLGSTSPEQSSLIYDKETGVLVPQDPHPLAAQPPRGRAQTHMPPRQKYSETPPSSARRYPGLFYQHPGEQQDGRRVSTEDSRPVQYHQPQQTQQPFVQGNIPIRAASGEFQREWDEDVEDEQARGRQNRVSGILGQIGVRIRSASRGRRGSTTTKEFPPFAPETSDLPVAPSQSDDVSAPSDAHDETADKKKKRRSGFLANLMGPKTAQDNDDSQVTSSQPMVSHSNEPSEYQLQSAHQRKGSFFGNLMSGQSNEGPSISRASTSSLAQNQEAVNATGQKSSRKRLSALKGKIFNRSSAQQQDQSNPSTSYSNAPSAHSYLSSTAQPVAGPAAGQGPLRGAPDMTMQPGSGRPMQYQGSMPQGMHQSFTDQDHIGIQPPGAERSQAAIQPPPFRTQGPPVHQVAGVASDRQQLQDMPHLEKSHETAEDPDDAERVAAAHDQGGVPLSNVVSDSSSHQPVEDTRAQSPQDLSTKPTMAQEGNPSEDQVKPSAADGAVQGDVAVDRERDVGHSDMQAPAGDASQDYRGSSPPDNAMRNESRLDVHGVEPKTAPFSPDHIQGSQHPAIRPPAADAYLQGPPGRPYQVQAAQVQRQFPQGQVSHQHGPQPPANFQFAGQGPQMPPGAPGHLSQPSTDAYYQGGGLMVRPHPGAQYPPRQQPGYNAYGMGPPKPQLSPGFQQQHFSTPPPQSSTPEPKNPLKKLFNRTSDQPTGQQDSGSGKRESSTKSLLNAFKRSSKQPEAKKPQESHQDSGRSPGRPSQVSPPPQQQQQQMVMMQQQQQRSSQMPPPRPQQQAMMQSRTQQVIQQSHPSQGTSPPPQLIAQGSMPSLRQPQPQAGRGHPHLPPHIKQLQHQVSSENMPAYGGPGPGQPRMQRMRSGDQPSPGSRGFAPGWSANIIGVDAPAPARQQKSPQPGAEPQYDPVPIPGGYAPVHGEGRTAPTPYNIGRGFQSPPSQQQAHEGQQWGQLPSGQGHIAHQAGVQPSSHHHQQHKARSSLPTNNALGIQQPSTSQDWQPSQQGSSTGMNPRQMQRRSAPINQIVTSNFGVSSGNQQASTEPVSDLGPSGSQGNRVQAAQAEPSTPAGQALSVNVQKANEEESNIYDATPRRAPPTSAKPADTDAAGENDKPEQTARDVATKPESVGSPASVHGAVSSDKQVVSPHREPEEKIYYNPDINRPRRPSANAANMKNGEGGDNEEPQMSATSYPGMEWNPYASGGYEDWND